VVIGADVESRERNLGRHSPRLAGVNLQRFVQVPQLSFWQLLRRLFVRNLVLLQEVIRADAFEGPHRVLDLLDRVDRLDRDVCCVLESWRLGLFLLQLLSLAFLVDDRD